MKTRVKSIETCETCRKRKVKCDGTRLNCVNCVKRQLVCAWPNQTPSTTPIWPISEIPGITNPPLNVSNLELLHHFTISTSLTIPHPVHQINPWHPGIISKPIFSPSQSYFVHALLASGSHHLFRLTNDRKYYDLAQQHFHTSMSLLKRRSPMEIKTDGDFSPMYLANFLLRAHMVTVGQLDSTYFWTEIAILSSRGVLVLATDVEAHVRPQDPSSATLPFLSRLYENFPYDLKALASSGTPDYEELLDVSTAAAYRVTISNLESTWRLSFYTQNPIEVFFRWASSIPLRFLDFILERRQRALIILAHFCAILAYLESKLWHFQGQPRHDLVKITALIQEQWFDRLIWPLSVVGMMPSREDHEQLNAYGGELELVQSYVGTTRMVYPVDDVPIGFYSTP